MRLWLYTIGSKAASSALSAQVAGYVTRASRYMPCEHSRFASEAALFTSLDKKAGRTAPILILTDSRGLQIRSEELADNIRKYQDGGAQHLALTIGPADGWSSTALERADLTIAFGRITLPHELAALIAAEQIYRALTILAGHPYHIGH